MTREEREYCEEEIDEYQRVIAEKFERGDIDSDTFCRLGVKVCDWRERLYEMEVSE